MSTNFHWYLPSVMLHHHKLCIVIFSLVILWLLSWNIFSQTEKVKIAHKTTLTMVERNTTEQHKNRSIQFIAIVGTQNGIRTCWPGRYSPQNRVTITDIYCGLSACMKGSFRDPMNRLIQQHQQSDSWIYILATCLSYFLLHGKTAWP